jgi:hypothetical protein
MFVSKGQLSKSKQAQFQTDLVIKVLSTWLRISQQGHGMMHIIITYVEVVSRPFYNTWLYGQHFGFNKDHQDIKSPFCSKQQQM